jgi:hypothetical protein
MATDVLSYHITCSVKQLTSWNTDSKFGMYFALYSVILKSSVTSFMYTLLHYSCIFYITSRVIQDKQHQRSDSCNIVVDYFTYLRQKHTVSVPRAGLEPLRSAQKKIKWIKYEQQYGDCKKCFKLKLW